MKKTAAWNKQLDDYYVIAAEAVLENRDPAAVELFKAYLKHRPNHAAALLFYGAALENIGQPKQAEAAYLRAIKFAPPKNRFYLQARLGKLFYDWGHYIEAETWYSRACRTKEGKQFGSLWIYRGSNYSRMRKFKHAEKCFLAATTMDNSDIDEAFCNLGNIYRAQGRYKEARAAYRKALKIDPDYTLAQEKLDSLKDIEKAVQKANSLNTKGKSK